MRKLITFLGPKGYSETTYAWGSRQYKTKYFAEAVAEWLAPDKVCVLLTPTARDGQPWAELQQRLEKVVSDVVPVTIPEGQDEQSLWKIFRAIDSEIVESGDELIFDVTHGYRSLPILFLLAAAYLRQVRNAKLQHILYGAYDARDTQTNISPVYELTPFVELLDWLTAAKIFMTTGDGRELALLMDEAQNRAHRGGLPDPPRQLKSLARAIREVSDNLLLSRVPALAESVQLFQKELHNQQLSQEIEKWLPPLMPLLREIEREYAPFTESTLLTESTLQAQAELIKWYAEHGHIIQAFTLAREWVINREMQVRGMANSWNVKEERERVEESLNLDARCLRRGSSTLASQASVKFWDFITNYRNDLAHCGFRKDPLKASAFQQAIPDLREQIRTLLEKVQEE